jgi:hypothetical protein
MSCLFAACDAGEKPAPPTTEAKPGPKVIRDQLTEPLMYLPVDSDLVIKLDVKALRTAKLWPTYRNLVAKWLTPGFAGCHYDPLSELSSVTIALPLKSEVAVAIARGIDRDKTLACLRAPKPSADGTATFDGDFVTLTTTAGPMYLMTFADAHTLVVQSSKYATKQSLTQVVQSGAPLAQDKLFTTAWHAATQTLQPGAAFVVSRPGSSELAAKWSTMGAHLEHLSAVMRVSDRLDVRLQMDVATAEEATRFAATMQSQLKSTKQFFDRGEATAQGKTITVDMGMTEAQLKTMATMVAGMTLQ